MTGRPATIIGGYALAIARALESSGVSSAALFHAAGVPARFTNDPLQRLSSEALKRLYDACVEATGNPYFGLTVAEHIHISNLHALGYALVASDTLMDFCLRVERYFRVVSESANVTVSEADDEVFLHGVHQVEFSGETEDAFLAFLVRSMRQLGDDTFSPLRVGFRHPAPPQGIGPYEALFRAPVSFDQPDPFLVFRKSDLSRPLAGACPELAQVNDNIAVKYLARLDKDDIISTVRQKIVELLPNGACTRDLVAESINMSPTALQFKLAKRRTSFHDLLEATRRELASGYVQQAGLSVTEIAFLLGFNDTSNFARAFKRWTGASPTEFRERVERGAPAA